MRTIELLQNPIQNYSWGSLSAIPELLGEAPSGKPQAELWMGAHSKSPSYVEVQGKWRSLVELIEESPIEILGEATAKKYSNQLPFLFKVLAAAKPLSIQAHPNREQAAAGFARENAEGLPFDSYRRNYRDPNHKPEIICALSPFWALKGFREVRAILASLRSLQLSVLAREVCILSDKPNPQGLQEFFRTLITSDAERSRQVVEEVLEAVKRSPAHSREAPWMVRLQDHFPGDIGVLSPTFLNLVQLKPGEALYLPAGELHAYLEGVGIELMANSDNVLRGGLTPKYIDTGELLRILEFESGEVEILTATQFPSGEKQYPSPAEEFSLAVVVVTASDSFTSARDRSVEILFCTEGTASISTPSTQGLVHLDRGSSVLVPAAVDQYRIEGEATLYRASVPI